MLIFSAVIWAAILAISNAVASLSLVSIFSAWLIMASNTLAGYVTFDLAFGKDLKSFYKFTIGSLVVRMMLSLALVAVLLQMPWIKTQDFILAMFAFYIGYTAIEVLAYQKKNTFEKALRAAKVA
ncbi:MAG: hypothetical protein IAF08_11045 [Rhizobacter sp.]|nr:hypothetical protein [Chlorobiales bacterium]